MDEADLGLAKPHLRVLIIEDDPAVAHGLARILKCHDVHIAANGRAALAYLEHHRCDVALCDLMMPDVTGMELHEQLSAAGDAIVDRFVFLTGGVSSSHAQEFLDRIGEARWVSKPIEGARLRQLVLDVGSKPTT